MMNIKFIAPIVFVAGLSILLSFRLWSPEEVTNLSLALARALPTSEEPQERGQFLVPFSNAEPWRMYMMNDNNTIRLALGQNRRCQWRLSATRTENNGAVIYDIVNRNAFQRFMLGTCDAGFSQVSLRLNGSNVEIVLLRGQRVIGRGTLYR